MQSTGEWWLQRRPMSRAHVVEYVTRLLWAAFAGMLRSAGIEVDPDQPLPTGRPGLALRTTGSAPAAAGEPRRSDDGAA